MKVICSATLSNKTVTFYRSLNLFNLYIYLNTPVSIDYWPNFVSYLDIFPGSFAFIIHSIIISKIGFSYYVSGCVR